MCCACKADSVTNLFVQISLELFLSGVAASLQFVLDMFMFDGLFYSSDVCHRYASEKSITECFMVSCMPLYSIFCTLIQIF